MPSIIIVQKNYTILRDEEKIEDTSITEYIATLNSEYRYWLITPHVECSIHIIIGKYRHRKRNN